MVEILFKNFKLDYQIKCYRYKNQNREKLNNKVIALFIILYRFIRKSVPDDI